MYAFLDGDDVGNRIEMLLLEGKVVEAKELSGKISQAMAAIGRLLEDRGRPEVILLAGDDVLIGFDDADADLPDQIRSIFTSTTGLSISCGIGDTIQKSIWNLHLAKLYGKNQTRNEG